MDSYKTYLNHPAGDVLPVEEAMQIYNDIFESISKCKIEDKDEFVEDFLSKSCKYASVRTQWEFWSREERIDKDSSRTIQHY